ncbi:hypothetical protein WN51_04177 [Melipona quadrifasciata]|uniref:Uncharacterized protein n=1 Tax=Melipona quadrifasciata TaxID=166423 RepID=A0A0N0BCI5_9HYME|nr:hypothetical protein WN51_04177 [Melipona quadrifasciata]
MFQGQLVRDTAAWKLSVTHDVLPKRHFCVATHRSAAVLALPTGMDVPFEVQECKPTQAHLGEYIAVKVKKNRKRREKHNNETQDDDKRSLTDEQSVNDEKQ